MVSLFRYSQKWQVLPFFSLFFSTSSGSIQKEHLPLDGRHPREYHSSSTQGHCEGVGRLCNSVHDRRFLKACRVTSEAVKQLSRGIFAPRDDREMSPERVSLRSRLLDFVLVCAVSFTNPGVDVLSYKNHAS